MKVKVWLLSCVRLFVDPMDCSLLGFSVHGIFQARVLEWVAISFSRGSSWPRDWTQVFCIAGRRFNLWATREASHQVVGIKTIVTEVDGFWKFYHLSNIYCLYMYLSLARDHSYFHVDIFWGPCITARKKDRKFLLCLLRIWKRKILGKMGWWGNRLERLEVRSNRAKWRRPGPWIDMTSCIRQRRLSNNRPNQCLTAVFSPRSKAWQ